MDDGQAYEDRFKKVVGEFMEAHAQAKLQIHQHKLEELIQVHKLDVSISIGTVMLAGSFTAHRLVAKTANRDHITYFKTLGLVTGMYQVDQIESVEPNQWCYLITPTAQ